jgi:kinesin family member 5
LVDLAGSERLSKTGATGKTLEEAKSINLSLTELGNSIKQLTDGNGFVNFRNSKLTLFLRESLGGNSKTTLVCTASKQDKHLEESI